MPVHAVIEGEKSRRKLTQFNQANNRTTLSAAKTSLADIHDRLSAIITFECRRFMTDNNLKMIALADGSLRRESWRSLTHQSPFKLIATRVTQQLSRDNDDQKSIEKALGLKQSLEDSFLLASMLRGRIARSAARWSRRTGGLSPTEWESAKTLPNWTPKIPVPSSTCQDLLTLLKQVPSSVVECQDKEERVQDIYSPSIWRALQTLQPVNTILPNGTNELKELSSKDSHSSQHYRSEPPKPSVFVLKDTLCVDKRLKDILYVDKRKHPKYHTPSEATEEADALENAFVWTLEKCALLIRARVSHKKKTWHQIAEENFPGKSAGSIKHQWYKMEKEHPNLLNLTVDEAVKLFTNDYENVSSEKE